MSDFYKTADDTPFNRAVDKAIAETNGAYLALLEDHDCDEHRRPLMQLDGTRRWQCSVCFRDFGEVDAETNARLDAEYKRLTEKEAS